VKRRRMANGECRLTLMERSVLRILQVGNLYLVLGGKEPHLISESIRRVRRFLLFRPRHAAFKDLLRREAITEHTSDGAIDGIIATTGREHTQVGEGLSAANHTIHWVEGVKRNGFA